MTCIRPQSDKLRSAATLAWMAGLGLAILTSISPAAEAQPSPASQSEQPLDAATLEFVSTKIRPLLESRCYECHSGKSAKLKGGLRLDTLESIVKGGDGGPILKPGHPEKSVLVEAINYRGDYEMPPASKMPPGEIALLTKWIEMGAPWPAGGEPPVSAAKEPFPLDKRKAAHWSWRAVADPPAPAVRQQDWARRDLDRFVLAKLDQANLKPAPDADRRTLLRRVWFDIVGLPPKPADVEAFVADPAPTQQALEKVVDALLASPQFGERWGRHWLDLMRYAESRGHEYDFNTPNAWQYRDYVIRALNADVPYNQFVVEHVAGDLVAPARLNPDKKYNESVLATGFWYLGDWVHSPVDIRRDEADQIDNQLDTMSRAFLGLTVACARCHDHKFDAISTKDYYALAGFLQSSSYRQAPFDTMEHNRLVADELWKVRNQSEAKIRTALAESLRPAAGQTAEYLRAAVAIVRAAQTPAAPTPSLEPKRLEAWVAALRAALNEPLSPLHEIAKRLQSPGATAASPSTSTPPPAFAVDYHRLAAQDWVQDGFAFGPGPTRSGALQYSDDPRRPVTGIDVFGLARRDRLWAGLGLAPGTQGDEGELGSLPRTGQMLRTPTLTIENGRVHLLVRGSGMLQTVVDAHRLLYGPLHKDLILQFNAGDKPRWITHNLGRYQGHRAHIELVPVGGGPLELLAISTSPQPPPVPQPGRTQLSTALASTPDPDGSAMSLQTLLLSVIDRLAAGTISTGPLPEETASLADWMVRHPELFTPEAAATQRMTTEFEALRREEQRLGGQIQKSSRTAIAILDGTGEDEELLIRGNVGTPHGRVPRRFLEALTGSTAPSYARGSGRLELAQQMVDPKVNPFITRVMANRIWHHLLGRGIVPSVDDFGVLGQPPSNPELLDHLATRLVADGWSVKRLIRQIATSRTYQMSSHPADAATETADPDNVLLHRMNLRRLEGEVIRDGMLAVSGRLDLKMEGPPVPIYLTSFMGGRGRPGSGPLDGAGRRSVYLSVRRNFLSPMMLAFDTPVPSVAVGRRNVSNVPAQPLILLNDPFVAEQARRWAERVLADANVTPENRVKGMYETALGRPPDSEETARAVTFLKEQTAAYGIAGDAWQKEPRAWTDLGHVIWNMKEFIFID
ncbi:MAG: PSD1 and planctomycete cytochrome C domain-containing protein [Planctomycetes bacterium]|nr:PSD1 and planctomycete cytochrome C domain-containing protein [Planctomycetota bacterium]